MLVTDHHLALKFVNDCEYINNSIIKRIVVELRHGPLCESGTSEGAGQARDLCGTEPKPGTSAGAGLNKGNLWEQV